MVSYDYPYVVVIDGDYDIIYEKNSRHRRAILLNKYSIENYLIEKEACEKICLDYSVSKKTICTQFDALINKIQKNVLCLIILDCIHKQNDTGVKILPNSINQIFERKNMCFERNKILNILLRAKSNYIPKKEIIKINRLIRSFIKGNSVKDLLKGHLALGIFRILIENCAAKKRGKKPVIDNDRLYHLLTLEVFLLSPKKDHKLLLNKLQQAVEDAKGLRANFY